MKKRILFLYTELAEYFMACVETLSKEVEEIHIVRWPVNVEAPFHFREVANVTVYNRKDFDKTALIQLAEKINPDTVVCSGWVDKDYLVICEKMHGKCPTVLTLDNWWQGSLKQKVLVNLARWKFRSVFSHAWIPGEPQRSFAQKLGFDENHISTGFYCADTDAFTATGEKAIEKKSADYPHRLLYVGRYLPFKGIYELWSAFRELQQESESNWELWCVGTGDEWNHRAEDDKIKHFGFLQPEELLALIPQAGAFVLPSHKEPWGVVVHEMAAAGLPLLCSDRVGAATAFLEEGKNGYSFKAGDRESLKNAVQKLESLPDWNLLEMGLKSLQLSKKITPQKWSETVLSF